MEKEFFALAETEGITDIEELNKILDRAVNLKNFLKGEERVDKVAQIRGRPLSRRTSSRWATRRFWWAWTARRAPSTRRRSTSILPPEYSEVVYTGNNNDAPQLKKWHLDERTEKQIRKDFAKSGEAAEDPDRHGEAADRLRRADALRDVPRQADARPHAAAGHRARQPALRERGGRRWCKPHGFVLDFVGIFDKLEKALAFDSDEINAIVKDLGAAEGALQEQDGEQGARNTSRWSTQDFNDKDVDDLIEHFRDKERRKEFFKEYKEIEMLYEIISPDAFLRPFIDDYTTLSSIYAVVRRRTRRRVYVDKAFQRKTNELVQKHIGAR